MIDACGRDIDYLRISITDRCNLRCVYCMPDTGVNQCSHSDMLSYEEITHIVRVAAGLGIRHLRVTGGEPMARKGCLDLVAMLHAIPGIETIAMTTNGILLDGVIPKAKQAGLTALNISLDTLDPDVYRAMTRGGDVTVVRRVIDDALAAGLTVKLNAVPVRGMNEDSLTTLAELARNQPICVRFIELMPLGCGKALTPIPSDEIAAMMTRAFGPLTTDRELRGYGPAKYVKPAGFVGSLGVISPLSHEFCGQCNRVRLMADGFLKLCLNHTAGLDLRGMLRSGADDAALAEALSSAIASKPSRHGFMDEQLTDGESRRMNQIGG